MKNCKIKLELPDGHMLDFNYSSDVHDSFLDALRYVWLLHNIYNEFQTPQKTPILLSGVADAKEWFAQNFKLFLPPNTPKTLTAYKLYAIKALRQDFNLSLKEAKDIVEANEEFVEHIKDLEKLQNHLDAPF